MKFIEVCKVTYEPLIAWIKANPGGYAIACLEGLLLGAAIIGIPWGVAELISKRKAAKKANLKKEES